MFSQLTITTQQLITFADMNVTKKNFKDVLPTVIEKLQTCKFVSFDLEMSGIYSTDKSKRNRKDDEPAQRYSKMIEPATTYSIVQFGLSTFHENVDGERITLAVHNSCVHLTLCLRNLNCIALQFLSLPGVWI